MQKAFKGVIAIALLMVCLQPVYSVPQVHWAEGTAPVNVQIERYMSVRIDHSFNLLVTKEMILEDGIDGLLDTSKVFVYSNGPTTLQAPGHVTVTGPGQYVTQVTLALVGAGNVKKSNDTWYWKLDQGAYAGDGTNGTISLSVYVEKDWDLTDHAGTYTGTIELQLLPR